MEEQRPAYLIQIPPEDWERTPASVKKLVEEMHSSDGKMGTTSSRITSSSAAATRESQQYIKEFIIATLK